MATSESLPRPRIVLRVGTRPGRYRRKADLTGPGGEAATLPEVSERGCVKVQVGLGLRAEDLPQTVAAARQLRHVASIEILGQTRRAVEDARTVLETAWEILDGQGTPQGDEKAAGAWLTLMVTMKLRETGVGGASFWEGRSFVDPFGGGGVR